MTKALLILLLLASTRVVNAQDNQAKISLSIGYSLPMGEFASHDFGYGGYALLGKTIGLQGSYFFSKNIGIGADVSMKDFRFASGYFLLDYIAAEPAFSSLDMLSTSYKVKSFFVGPYYKLSLTNRLSANYKVLGGIVISRTPDQLFTAEAFSVGKTYFWKTSARSISPAFLSGIDLNYKIFEHVEVGVQFDFSYTRAKYTFIRGTEKYYDFLHIPLLQLVPGITIIW